MVLWLGPGEPNLKSFFFNIPGKFYGEDSVVFLWLPILSIPLIKSTASYFPYDTTFYFSFDFYFISSHSGDGLNFISDFLITILSPGDTFLIGDVFYDCAGFVSGC